MSTQIKPNEIEDAVDEYVQAKLPQLENLLRHAFLEGVTLGINLSDKIYRPVTEAV